MSKPSYRPETKSGAVAAKAAERSPLSVRARSVFLWIAWICSAGILVQIFLAGLALFWNPSQWASHTGFVRILIVLPLLMLVTSFAAKLPASLRWRSAGLIGLIVLIAVSANLSSNIGYMSALHPVIAVLLLGETMSIARKTRILIRER